MRACLALARRGAPRAAVCVLFSVQERPRALYTQYKPTPAAARARACSGAEGPWPPAGLLRGPTHGAAVPGARRKDIPDFDLAVYEQRLNSRRVGSVPPVCAEATSTAGRLASHRQHCVSICLRLGSPRPPWGRFKKVKVDRPLQGQSVMPGRRAEFLSPPVARVRAFVATATRTQVFSRGWPERPVSHARVGLWVGARGPRSCKADACREGPAASGLRRCVARRAMASQCGAPVCSTWSCAGAAVCVAAFCSSPAHCKRHHSWCPSDGATPAPPEYQRPFATAPLKRAPNSAAATHRCLLFRAAPPGPHEPRSAAGRRTKIDDLRVSDCCPGFEVCVAARATFR